MERRFEAYKARIVKPFFRDHFARIDRQVVLVDLLGAIHAGPQAVEDLGRSMNDILAAFRPGRNAWLTRLLGQRRVERILFAATKADHIHHSQHGAMTAIMEAMLRQARDRADFAGARTRAMAIASLRATVEEMRAVNGTELGMVRGKLEGGREAVLYPRHPARGPLATAGSGSGRRRTLARRRLFGDALRAQPRHPAPRGRPAAYPARPRRRVPARGSAQMIPLRPARDADCPALGDILQDWIEATPWMPVIHSRQETHGFLRLLHARTRITVPCGDPVGGFLARDGEEIDAFYLAPASRGRGIGTALMRAAQARSMRLHLWCFQANTGAQRFYARHGFTEIARSDGAGNEEKLPDLRLEWSRP